MGRNAAKYYLSLCIMCNQQNECHHRHRQGERPTHQLAESLRRDEFVNKKCHEKAENSLR